MIGRHEDPEIQLGNKEDGIQITSNSQDNQIIENMIGHNVSNGVRIMGNQTIRNRISRNSITNDGKGIENSYGGNTELSPPQIQSVTNSSISGTAPANSIVEVFFDFDDEGEMFMGEVPTDDSGNFSWSGEEKPPEFYFTATATDAEGNTSEFSEPVRTSVKKDSKTRVVKSFSLYQNYPNPFNPETTIRFDIPANNQPQIMVNLNIYNLQGQLVRTLLDEEKSSGEYSVKWNGLDNNGEKVTTGIYLYTITAGDFKATNKMAILK